MEHEAMMDHEETGESAINLSTNHTTRSNSSPTPNGSADIKNGDVQASKSQRSKLSHSLLDGTSLALSPSLLMMNPQLLIRQQMQQLLHQQVISPSQIQQLLTQHQSLFLQQQQQQQQLKQLESMIPHLQEQLQLNMVQQTQILQQLNSAAASSAGEKVNNRQQLQVQLQHLAVQQHQLMQQIQLSHQQQYVLGVQPLAISQGLSPSDLQNIWKDGSGNNQEENGAKITGLNGMLHSPPPLINTQPVSLPPLLNGQSDISASSTNLPSSSSTSIKEEVNSASSPSKNPLYGHGVCRWPGCETVCETQQSFLKHINTEHQLDDRSTAQARVQMQVVSQLEIQLAKEKERLQAMMQHLHMTQSSPATSNSSTSKMDTPVTSSAKMSRLSPQLPTVASSSCSPSLSAAVTTTSPTTPLVTVAPRLFSQSLHPPALSSVGAIRRRLSEKNYSPMSEVPLLPDSPIRRRVAERSNLDINEEINRNREFYRTADVRPPFTYASLIRQAIVEAADKQLTLNEIYNWFQNTFCYFRRNAATWKNAVRHNLSLHKCFMRVENVKGAVWTVDELEFYKRRPQRIQERVSGSQSQDTNQVGSPPLHHNPVLYGDSLNASLQAALAENNMSFLSNATSVSSLVSNSLLALAATSSPNSINPAISSESDCFSADVANHNSANKLSSGEIQVKEEPLANDPESDNTKPHYFTDDSQQDDAKCHSSEGSEDMDVAEDLSLSSSENHTPLCPRGGCL